MSEGIIDLHHILFYLYKCHEQTCCHGSAWAYGMTADNHVSRGSPLIGAARQRFPRANWCGQPRGCWARVGQEISERTDVFCDVIIKGY